MKANHNKTLFVAGFPRLTQDEEVLAYFRNFGSIMSVERLNPGQDKYLFKVVTKDLASYQAILCPLIPHRHLNRHLMVKPFVSGRELANQNLILNQCRVIAKNVPASLSPDGFQSWVEMVAGPVLKLFCFQSDSPLLHPVPLHRKRNSYSILFRGKESADNLIALGQWTFLEGRGNNPTTFLMFCFQEARKQNQTLELNNRPSNGLQGGLRNSPKLTETSYSKPQGTFPESSPTKSRTEQTKGTYSSKPTSKKYFTNRNQGVEASSPAGGNLRFRLGRKASTNTQLSAER